MSRATSVTKLKGPAKVGSRTRVFAPLTEFSASTSPLRACSFSTEMSSAGSGSVFGFAVSLDVEADTEAMRVTMGAGALTLGRRHPTSTRSR